MMVLLITTFSVFLATSHASAEPQGGEGGKRAAGKIDELGGARLNDEIMKNNAEVLAGRFAGHSTDRVTIYSVGLKWDPCTRDKVIFETRNPFEVSELQGLLGKHDAFGDKIEAHTDRTNELVIALFERNKPVAWLVISRSYDSIVLFHERRLPDGRSKIGSGRVFNHFAGWMKLHKVTFEPAKP